MVGEDDDRMVVFLVLLLVIKLGVGVWVFDNKDERVRVTVIDGERVGKDERVRVTVTDGERVRVGVTPP